ncbi:MtnX-like HAD-IB family phosphatase [Natranaerobius thermophilus]|uniref:2,3-diketo-5-methylthio-1-phosphopentane phosphatase n=1 Tax=Natranaerobius thermophilus (strain ATCC BAA-1301 / DSM 18059 / JW/NM-WN-LF) TaxID=457570 RepID=B2A3E5_NATTJ|nr:MtnX-like HAD-IB family phosphatase [Natranaerobius thermophilus]ACB86374.1 2,3-diketo-5-methylthio-1-phosphopentane phosphatase [Natranaerobius thermophilus JW/NM-WN-LF]
MSDEHTNRLRKPRLFVTDFDGTVTFQDSCNLMIQTCARNGWQELNQQWEKGELTTKDVARETFKLFDCSWEDVSRAISNIQIDPDFKKFVDIINREGDQLYIVSDGYDLLIKEILGREGLSHIPFYANKLLVNNRNFSMTTPYSNDNCHQCGSCKTAIIRSLISNFKTVPKTIYVGDGYSDRCPIEIADLVFAKEKLYQIAKSKGIEANKIKSFQDVINKLDIKTE